MELKHFFHLLQQQKRHFLRHLYIKRTFYQDRLETNIGKTQQKSGVPPTTGVDDQPASSPDPDARGMQPGEVAGVSSSSRWWRAAMCESRAEESVEMNPHLQMRMPSFICKFSDLQLLGAWSRS